MLRQTYRTGDTLIEVLFAITVFSMIAVGALTIMNRGTAIAQTSLETTLVRQQIDNQAESLRYLNAAYVAAVGNQADTTTGAASQWTAIEGKAVTTVIPFQSGTCTAPTTGNPFFIDSATATVRFIPVSGPGPYAYQAPPTYAQISGSGATVRPQGLWIVAVRPSTTAVFTDFYINACWWVSGSDTPETIGTVVRLYAPN